ncbi:hypothetical protein [Haladaptatus salinisoli]|uniref:hypothetical protein n=1 Tax=Haladaptatus salinisoli TaxID=2884876 RepID=UPI001D0A09BB|nr:hypothetical protein [Haladaptatus salinisoli]
MTGVEIEIEEPVLFERVRFSAEGDVESDFSAPGVHFRASFAEGERAFREEPTVADDDAEQFEEVEFAWFEEMPEDAHPNHEEHVRLFFE